MLTTSPEALRAYELEQEAKRSKQTVHERQPKGNNKRRASAQLVKENAKAPKYQRSVELLSMTVKEAYDEGALFPARLDENGLAIADDGKDDIELVLRRLFALHKLIGPASGGGSVATPASDVHDEEYRVERILKLEMGTTEPEYHVKWLGYGYDELTSEPVANVYDCKAFEVFSANFVQTHAAELTRVWHAEMQRQRALEAPDAANAAADIGDGAALAIAEQFDYYTLQTFLFQLCLFNEAGVNRKTKTYQCVLDKFQSIAAHHKYYVRRLRQLQAMHTWHESINSIDKSKNIRVENCVDFEVPPHDEFIYTNDRIAHDGIIIPDDPPVGCECSTVDGHCSGKSNCCPDQFDSKFAYTSKGLLRVPQGTPIFECNKRCSCSDSCPNRVVQKGRKQSLCIFKTANERGWGVRTDRLIAKGAYVSEYVGEIISAEETERRGKEYDARGRTYLFDLDFNEKDNPYTVDAAKYGNISRFMNHSCNPNVGVWAVWTDCLDLDLPRLCIFTLRAIKENEELTFDYMNCMNTNQNDDGIDQSVERSKSIGCAEVDSLHPSIDGDVSAGSIESASTAANRTADEGNGSYAEQNGSILTNDRTTDEGNGSITETSEEQKTAAVVNDAVSNSSIDGNVSPIRHDQSGLEPVEPNLSQQSSDAVAKVQAFECKCGADNCRKILFF